MSAKEQFIDEALSQRKKDLQFRELTPLDPFRRTSVWDGKRELVNFSSNDYLGLSQHPEVIARAQKYAKNYGAGATASRLVNGTLSIHERLEQKLAITFGWESALLFNSGFQANSTIISTLADRHALILADKLSHNSLLQGALVSRATFRRFDHNDLSDLEQYLKEAQKQGFSRIVVITESVFSMDGDKSDLKSIAKLAQRYGAWVYADDAHAVGVLGEKGLGLTYSVPGIDMVLGTFGKAFGSFGAYLLCTKKVRDYMVNFCPGFIYSTALPPQVIGSIEAALELIPTMDKQRKQLQRNIAKMRNGIRRAGFETGASDSQIIPIMIGDEHEALSLANYIENQGFLAKAIRPPTVPQGSARIRITLSAEHTESQIDDFIKTLKDWVYG